MALNFPSAPELNDEYTSSGVTWQWDGNVWNLKSTPSVAQGNNFGTISVAGQDSVVADSSNDTLTLVEGANVTLTTNSLTDSITISATGGGGEGVEQNLFLTVTGDNDQTITATTPTSELIFAGSNGINCNPDSNTNTVHITYTGTVAFDELTDTVTANSLTVDKIYEPAIAMLRVDNVGVSAYTFNSHYSGDNPTIYAIAGTTLAFDLTAIPGHPFEIQDPTGDPYNTGVVHVASDGTVSTGADAQGKSSGTLYWRVTESISGNYRYQCQSHAPMFGTIVVKRLSVI